MKTTYSYDVVFNDDEHSNSKGFAIDLHSAIAYIQANNGSNFSYFADYKGGTVSVVCNQTGETVYEEPVKDLKTQVPADASTFALKGRFTTREWIDMLGAINGVMRTTGIAPREELAGNIPNNDALSNKIKALTSEEGESLMAEIERFWQNDISFTNHLKRVL